jgi:uncharacterized protein DUF5309
VAQPTNTNSTYKNSTAPNNTIREDLEDIYYKISPLECPVMQAIGKKGKFAQPFHEWTVVELAAANGANAQIEGGDATNDAPTEGLRFGNYTQIMNKVAQVSTTNERTQGVANLHKMKKQVLFKTQELKRDQETRLVSASIAVAGSDTVARQTAGIAAFLRTNTSRGASGANGTLSGTTGGYPNGAETAGTARALTETMLKSVIQSAWTQGGNPRYAFTTGTQKVNISAFTGNATRFKKAEDKKLIAAIDVYESDFGQLQIVPDRFFADQRILVLDPEYAEIGWLEPTRNVPLARTGLSERRQIWNEWGTIVSAEKSHAMVTDLT